MILKYWYYYNLIYSSTQYSHAHLLLIYIILKKTRIPKYHIFVLYFNIIFKFMIFYDTITIAE